MSKPCTTLKAILTAIKIGGDIENVIPYDLSAFSEECQREILALYIKYGANKERVETCKRVLSEL